MSPGDFVWHEMWSPAPQRAAAFYTGLLGWRTASDAADVVLYSDDLPVARIRRARSSIPPHTAAGIEVADLDAALGWARSRGCSVLDETAKGPGTRDRAISVVDPAAGHVLLIRPDVESPRTGRAFCWHQLDTPDPDRAGGFYGGLVGWVSAPSGVLDTSIVHGRTARRLATFTRAPSALPAQWISYVAVDSLSSTLERVERLGGAVITAYADLPPIGATCLMYDIDGFIVACAEAEAGRLPGAEAAEPRGRASNGEGEKAHDRPDVAGVCLA